MAGIKDMSNEQLEEIVRGVTPEQRMALEEINLRQVSRQRQELLRESLPGALARALWETRMHHRSVQTGRCCMAAGW